MQYNQPQNFQTAQANGQMAPSPYAGQMTSYSPYSLPLPTTNLVSDRFLKGVLFGAAAAYLMTNESVQRAVVKTAVKTWGLLQGGVAEVKERFEDAKAEVGAEARD